MSPLQIHWLANDDPPEAFPPVDRALIEPNGLLAAGGDLSTARLLYAYRAGIFPWFEAGQPVLWWSPDPRCVLQPDQFHASRSLKRCARSGEFLLTFNRACPDVIDACSNRRKGQSGTWITAGMKQAYVELHASGWVHSVEVWRQQRLVGGIYGLASGAGFYGESMFSEETNASKIAMLALCRILRGRSFVFLDCQLASPHLLSLGARQVPRSAFQQMLAKANRSADPASFWPEGWIPAAKFL
ncbi:MAG: leucyl/phenylalanyl-tRNA--protein transferase [Gammaproteobacteria bacterium]|nr:leucyl/phenylalanyl-tRNA--protein transferase [Gammaproteobacteria bacterium]MDH4313399.1 leucyl/phenylalanyl-tRNA--protein transferase [Gammaproteobacteria bacterium]MDH5501968.1 leucyl/phenylalanyl-tRNA--protein transferase [Gammaproteobacteria bacterium]